MVIHFLVFTKICMLELIISGKSQVDLELSENGFGSSLLHVGDFIFNGNGGNNAVVCNYGKTLILVL